MVAQKKSLGPFQGPNEEAAFDHLAATLPNGWHVIANRQLDTARHEEVDFFVLGMHNLFIIEEKSWGPRITYGDLRWTVTDFSGKHSDRKSPFIDLTSKARITAGWLRDKIAGFSNVKGHKVVDIVLLTHPMIEASVRVGVNDTGKVFALKEISEKLISYDAGNNDGIFKAHRDSILRLLWDHPYRDLKIPRFKDFKVKRQLESGSAVANSEILKYEAENIITGDEYHLKCYVTGDGNYEADSAEEQIRRDYKVSAKLQATQRAWSQSAPFIDEENELLVYPFQKPEGALSLNQLNEEANLQVCQLYRKNLVNLISEAFCALVDLDNAGILHRMLSPSRIWITRGSRIVFNDFIVSHHEGELTVRQSNEDILSMDFRAPECRENVYLAQHKSDVYALASSFISTFDVKLANADYVEGESEAPSDLIVEILRKCISEDLESRPTAIEVIQFLEARVNPQSGEGELKETEATEEKITGNFEEQLFARRFGDNYTVLEKLGSGGSGISWLAQYQSGDEINLVVIKEAKTVESFEDLQNEYSNSRKFTAHIRCSRGNEVKKDPKPGFIVNTYMSGMTLKKFLDIGNLELSYVESAFLSSLEVLSHIHKQGFIHGDISPNNILVDDESGIASLIDFGCLREFGKYQSVFGTRKTYAPEIASFELVDAKADIYALGATFLNLLLNRPHRNIDKGDQFEGFAVISLLDHEILQFSESYCYFINVLFKLVNPASTQRPDADEIKELVLKRDEKWATSPNSHLQPMINPTVDHLRSLFTASKDASNGSIFELLMNNPSYKEFYDKTFIETSLERELLPEIINGKRKVLLLTGNPGGGKTSFLHAIYEKLLKSGGKINSHLEDDASAPEWFVTLGNKNFHAILDASQSYKDRTANSMVLSALNGAINGQDIALIAINDGRLKQIVREYQNEFPALAKEVDLYFKNQPSEDPDYVILDLKSRSVVGLNGEGIFAESIDVLSKPNLWEICSQCSLQDFCPINENRQQIQESTHKTNLSRMTLLTYLRRSERPNFRRIRSAIGFLITGDLTCNEIKEKSQSGELSFQEFKLRNLAFKGTSGDSLVDSWASFDPALRVSPKLRNIISSAESQIPEREISQGIYAQYARKAYFSETLDAHGEITSEITPYLHSNLYREYLAGSRTDISPILQGLSKLSGSHFPYRGGLCVSDIEPGIGWAVIKVIPAEEFQINVDNLFSKFVDTTPESITLLHAATDLHFRMNIDTFELIIRSSQGEIFNDVDTGAIRFDLASFTTMLLRSPVSQAYLMDPSGSDMQVHMESGKIYLNRGLVENEV